MSCWRLGIAVGMGILLAAGPVTDAQERVPGTSAPAARLMRPYPTTDRAEQPHLLRRLPSDIQSGVVPVDLPAQEPLPQPAPLLPAGEPGRPTAVIPPDYAPWWQAAAMRPLSSHTASRAVDIESLLLEALRHSARVQAISENTVIAQTAITRADAEFDVHAFMESKFARTSVPTGSTLDAGFNVPRLREEDWFSSAGVRRKNRYGGRVELSQRLGTRDSNSNFFFPDNQGNSRLTLSYNHPLLNGAGQAYNSSLVVLANFDTRIAVDRSAAELQDHFLEITETFWQLYLQRAALLQKWRHLDRAQVILQRLDSRRDLDALDSQIARAHAAVALRRTELTRAGASIRNAESRLRALLNSPELLADRTTELVPSEPPTHELVPVELPLSVLTAWENRPEIDLAAQELEAARVRCNISKSELLPVLDVVLETYVSGLRGEYDIGQSWVDQFSRGEPSYTAGLLFDVPLQRRAAKANQTRREAELRQLASRFRATVENVNSEVEIAVREVETSFREMQAKYEAMGAAESDMHYLERRWDALPGDDRAASMLLADLLDAQDRLAFAELNFARAEVEYTVGLTRLNRALGMLLKHEPVVLTSDVEE